jgi:inner membrane protein
MDTLAHGLTGALIGYAGYRQRGGRAAAWTAVAAGVFPDADFILAFVDGATYLRWHRGPTHSVILWPLWSLFVAWVFWELTGRKHGRTLYGAALAAMGAHIFMDWITSYGTMLFSPFSDARYELSWVFIVDVYVWALLAAGLGVAIATQRAAVARGFLVALAGYFLFCGGARAWALRQAERTEQTVRMAAFPQPLNPLRWTIVRDDGDAVHWIDGGENHTFVSFRDEQLWPQAEATEAVRLFRWFAMFPVVEKVTTEDRVELVYRDLRFRTRLPGGRVREGKFVAAKAIFDRHGRLLAAGLTSAE